MKRSGPSPSGENPVPASGLVTVSTAATWLSISESLVYRLVRDGQLPARTIPGIQVLRIRLADLEAFACGMPRVVAPIRAPRRRKDCGTKGVR